MKEKKRNKRRLLYILTVLMLAGAAVFSGYQICRILSEYRREVETSQQFQQFINLEATHGAVSAVEGTESAANAPAATEKAADAAETEPVYYPVVDFESLTEVNDDVIGWIYIPDTNVNYPIVQGTDNRHYVSTMADGSSNAAGSIFMDYRNAPEFTDRHTVIYGHNMRNGSMFANIVDYKKSGYLEAHPIGMIMTPAGNFRLEVIGGYVADLSDSAWQLEFAGEDDFSAWLEETLSRTGDVLGVRPDGTDRIVTLSTCSYEFSGARYVLVCRIVE